MVLLWHCSNCYLTLQNHVSVENITTLLMKTQWKEFPALFPCTLKHHLIKKNPTLARCHYNIGRNVVLIETMCSDPDPSPYLKGQGHMRHLMVRVHMLVSAL